MHLSGAHDVGQDVVNFGQVQLDRGGVSARGEAFGRGQRLQDQLPRFSLGGCITLVAGPLGRRRQAGLARQSGQGPPPFAECGAAGSRANAADKRRTRANVSRAAACRAAACGSSAATGSAHFLSKAAVRATRPARSATSESSHPPHPPVRSGAAAPFGPVRRKIVVRPQRQESAKGPILHVQPHERDQSRGDRSPTQRLTLVQRSTAVPDRRTLRTPASQLRPVNASRLPHRPGARSGRPACPLRPATA